MKCPNCNSESTLVYNSRQRQRGLVRSRRCQDCGKTFTAVERYSLKTLKEVAKWKEERGDFD